MSAQPNRRMDFEREADLLIDEAYLESQVPKLAGTRLHTDYYLAQGLDEGLNPTRYFDTDWYAWQNPDWLQTHGAPYLHYLDIGAPQGRDPSPFVDTLRFRDATRGVVPNDEVYAAILSGLRAPALGVYESEEDLARCQRAFLSAISVCAHRVAMPRRRRPALVICQAGRDALVGGWADAPDREWDLFMNYYDAEGMRPGLGEYVLCQKGTKFSAMAILRDRFPEILAAYEHVLFLDDDVETSVADLNALFAACRRNGLDLAQMTLTPQSSCNWPHLFTRLGRIGPRSVSAVEIMMPVFSRRALGWLAPTLGQSVSGFGLDLVWGHLVAQRGGRIAVLDGISATHVRPVDQGGGAYYKYLRHNGINAKAELWTLLKRYGASRDMVTV